MNSAAGTLRGGGADSVSTARNVRVASAILRVTLGVMYLAHGVVLKILTFGFSGTAQFFGSIGLPAALAYLTTFAEAIGGALLVLGIRTRAVALALIPVLMGATWVHIGNGYSQPRRLKYR